MIDIDIHVPGYYWIKLRDYVTIGRLWEDNTWTVLGDSRDFSNSQVNVLIKIENFSNPQVKVLIKIEKPNDINEYKDPA